MRHWLLTAVMLTAVFGFAQSQPAQSGADQKPAADNNTTAASASDTKPETKTEEKKEEAKADPKAASKSDAKPADAKAADSKTAEAKPAGTNGCLAVKPIGSHAFRNIMLAGVAGALISKQQYQVVDVVDYPTHVGSKFHGNDLQTISSNGTKVVILDKKYKEEDVQKACH